MGYSLAIDQVCSVKMTRYSPSFFLRVYGDGTLTWFHLFFDTVEPWSLMGGGRLRELTP